MSHPDLLSWLQESMRENADLVALRVRRDGAWHTLTYRELDDLSSRLATRLLRSGLTPEDRVAIHAGNSPEWTIVDLACLKARITTVPVYTTSTPRQIAYVLRDCRARVVFSGTPALLALVDQALPLLAEDGDAPDVTRHLLSGEAAGVETLADLLDRSTDVDEELLAQAASGVTGDTTVTIIYTSGTTGDPKGVLLDHRGYVAQNTALDTLFDMPRGGRNMSFLPLTHAYERAWTYYVLCRGMQVCSVTDPKRVADAMLDIHPDTFVSVPRLYEKVYAGAHARADTPVKKRLFDWAFRVGGTYRRRLDSGRPASRVLAAQHAVADRLVLHHVRDAVGGPKNAMACGGAPLRKEVEEFFHAAGLPLYQGYGLTETYPLISCNAPGHVKAGTVGRAVPGVQIRIAAETGEICVKGEAVTRGYLDRPEDTATAIDPDGWFHTGDVGHVDAEGYLVITDRIKDLIVTMQGKNIAPAPIESSLAADPLVEAAVVVGDGRPYLTALIQPSFDDLEQHARSRGWSFENRETLLAAPEVQDYYTQLVARVGADAAKYERVQKFRLLADELTMDAGELTPTLKVRRGPVERRYAPLIDEMYAGV